ncbi:hypothetical protein [Methylobacterium aerolatum]|uniref:Translation initiation factor 2 n=1 Tax=Methylobacterium aerolatum TaxID=418708 RepID=A0ABU0I103_9HYPH|nr:hypothetical protein [Methylobacterium aerolatum]MDQ0448260.1 hypothetical protein [Methylobacterium aerolatum]GJD35737.1 hypothetical protein FMGBMHLM_2649 [Methylobacterium aerolatum]
MKCRLVVAVLAAVGLSGCASTARKAGIPMVFVSTPPGASVTITKLYTCSSTPCTILVDRNDAFDATFSLAGYQPQTVPVRKLLIPKGQMAKVGMGIGMVGVGSGGGLGFGTGTGVDVELGPNPVIVTLEPEKPPAPPRRRLKSAPLPAAEPAAPPRPTLGVREGDPASPRQAAPPAIPQATPPARTPATPAAIPDELRGRR